MVKVCIDIDFLLRLLEKSGYYYIITVNSRGDPIIKIYEDPDHIREICKAKIE